MRSIVRRIVRVAHSGGRCDGGGASSADDGEAIAREPTVADEGAEDASSVASSAPLWMPNTIFIK